MAENNTHVFVLFCKSFECNTFQQNCHVNKKPSFDLRDTKNLLYSLCINVKYIQSQTHHYVLWLLETWKIVYIQTFTSYYRICLFWIQILKLYFTYTIWTLCYSSLFSYAESLLQRCCPVAINQLPMMHRAYRKWSLFSCPTKYQQPIAAVMQVNSCRSIAEHAVVQVNWHGGSFGWKGVIGCVGRGTGGIEEKGVDPATVAQSRSYPFFSPGVYASKMAYVHPRRPKGSL